VFKDVTGPISIGLGPMETPATTTNHQKPGIIRNISFNGLHGTVVKPVPLRDSEHSSNYNPGEMFSCIVLNGVDNVLENISFNDVHLTYPGGGTAEHAAVRDVPKIAGEYYQIGIPPAYGIYARNVKGLTLNNMRFETQTEDLRPVLIMDSVEDAAINGFSAQGQLKAESLLRFINSRDVLITAMRILTRVSTLIRVEGKASSNIKIDGGDLSKAQKHIELSAASPSQAITIRG
jgi:hypothetical protein